MSEQKINETYVRKLPLKKIISSKKVLDAIEDVVIRTNHVVRETYQFIRLYFLYLLQSNQKLPEIDRTFIKMVFSIISIRPRTGKAIQHDHKDGLKLFYDEHYKELQLKRVIAPGADLLDYEIVGIITNVENHIKNSFFTYITRLVYSISDDKEQIKKIREDLFDNTRKSREEFHADINIFSTTLNDVKKHLYSNPQNCLPFLYKISCFIEQKGLKQLAILPLRRSFIPCHITIDSSSYYATLKDIPENSLADMKKQIIQILGHKEGYEFTSMKTDGISCSVTFRTEKHCRRKKTVKNPEIYLEDIMTKITLENGQKIVGIDPNKGNLVYCYDGDKTLRYTQDERRWKSRKTKYKRIRKKISDDDKGVGIEDKDNEKMSEYNSRSCNFEKFKEYVREKNKMAEKWSLTYERNIFRKLRFNSKINLKSSEDLFINKFKKTYGSDALVCIGDWEERPSFLRGKEPTKGKSMRTLFRKSGYKVYLLDEFRTSKTCHLCKGENENNTFIRKDPRPWKSDDNQKVWGLLRCKNVLCRSIHNRDYNSSSNMYKMAVSMIKNKIKPSYLDRKKIQSHGVISKESSNSSV